MPITIVQLNTVATNTQRCVVCIADLHTMLSSMYYNECVEMEMQRVLFSIHFDLKTFHNIYTPPCLS